MDTELIKHGTVAVDKKLPVFERLVLVYQKYYELACQLTKLEIEEVHIEQLPRSCHIYTHYSVAIIGMPFAHKHCSVVGDIPISSWQKHCDWNGEREILKAHKVSSEDELAAIAMGLWYIDNKVK